MKTMLHFFLGLLWLIPATVIAMVFTRLIQ